LTAGTEYCMADRAEPPAGSGWYCNRAKDPTGKVELDCGITVQYSQTGDPANNGACTGAHEPAPLVVL
jgi:hypothetical protein